jgi:GNAT superfamily N-acetyltransferase
MKPGQSPPYPIRRATPADERALRALIGESVRDLARADYTDAQIAAALGSAWGLDTQLVSDGTYFVAEAPEAIVGCGGWSYRKTLFGSDANLDRNPETLDPARDAARIRAFFVHPSFVRRGIGRALLEKCEEEAMRHGFHRMELLATFPGHRLYRAHGYLGDERRPFVLPGGITVDAIPMAKALMPVRKGGLRGL